MTALHLAGRRFPVVGLIYPSDGETYCGHDYGHGPHEGPRERSRYQRSIGDDRNGWYIPCENGLLILVENEWFRSGRWALSVALYSRHCSLMVDSCGCSMCLPASMLTLDGRIGPSAFGLRGHYWSDADPEWAVELIDRVSVMPVDEPDGPIVEIIGVDALRAIAMAEANG